MPLKGFTSCSRPNRKNDRWKVSPEEILVPYEPYWEKRVKERFSMRKKFFDKYSKPNTLCDELDFKTLEVVVDRGHLRQNSRQFAIGADNCKNIHFEPERSPRNAQSVHSKDEQSEQESVNGGAHSDHSEKSDGNASDSDVEERNSSNHEQNDSDARSHRQESDESEAQQSASETEAQHSENQSEHPASEAEHENRFSSTNKKLEFSPVKKKHHCTIKAKAVKTLQKKLPLEETSQNKSLYDSMFCIYYKFRKTANSDKNYSSHGNLEYKVQGTKKPKTEKRKSSKIASGKISLPSKVGLKSKKPSQNKNKSNPDCTAIAVDLTKSDDDDSSCKSYRSTPRNQKFQKAKSHESSLRKVSSNRLSSKKGVENENTPIPSYVLNDKNTNSASSEEKGLSYKSCRNKRNAPKKQKLQKRKSHETTSRKVSSKKAVEKENSLQDENKLNSEENGLSYKICRNKLNTPKSQKLHQNKSHETPPTEVSSNRLSSEKGVENENTPIPGYVLNDKNTNRASSEEKGLSYKSCRNKQNAPKKQKLQKRKFHETPSRKVSSKKPVEKENSLQDENKLNSEENGLSYKICRNKLNTPKSQKLHQNKSHETSPTEVSSNRLSSEKGVENENNSQDENTPIPGYVLSDKKKEDDMLCGRSKRNTPKNKKLQEMKSYMTPPRKVSSTTLSSNERTINMKSFLDEMKPNVLYSFMIPHKNPKNSNLDEDDFSCDRTLSLSFQFIPDISDCKKRNGK